LFVTKLCLCDKRIMNDIVYRLHIIRLDASLLKFLSVEFRIPVASFQLCFEPAELKGLQLLPIHRLDLWIEIFSSLVHFTPHVVDSRIRNVFHLELSALGEHAFVPFWEGRRIETKDQAGTKKTNFQGRILYIRWDSSWKANISTLCS